MILNPIICEDCGKELQPENLRIGFDNDKLIRICGFCGNEVEITYPNDVSHAVSEPGVKE